ncbi:30S ribosome-binding factor RbfA [Akkermansia muciniphila]|nr:30S ribosome-binding factor RbfA [Akkermansia muciniphila]
MRHPPRRLQRIRNGRHHRMLHAGKNPANAVTPKTKIIQQGRSSLHAPPGVRETSVPVLSLIPPSPIEPIGPFITLSLHMSRRTDKVNELLRREIGTTIQRDFEFPGTIVTVIEVEVTDDLKEGKVWVGVVGKMTPSQVLEKLNSRHGLIQSAVARRVVLRNTPRLTFRLDDSAQRGVDLVNLLEDIDKNLPKAPPADAENDEE